ncbi:SDR family NAD(P)-dependent oxidoreductase [Natronorubrum daqingense]|uniref:NAD(P)-dependent dehydrogenase, short-chain alcohol dehydrogenase family n=1 Tax=Natronorubrum daqingense TaxID=588898 RepID=A0A1N7ET10_9EURY|nr:SDR family NAD(P)-dependent oxidoreductase [Natronorubrum daqingense]APX97735.1 short-chain dehydrogenase [Natronorubrum daqingense]SIR91159.1 NAD(P)-dependent dehydrogenase, short-chain alcohol dehydrogenase family [Natronorubrum daqingense]
MNIQGETALVTGASVGIGRLISTELASHGVTVVVADLEAEARRDTVAEIEAAGGTALETHLDLTDPEGVADTIDDVLEEVGTIDILVNNAGIAGPTAPLEETSLEAWDRTHAVNLRGAFCCTKAVIGEMKAQGDGRIVNISSASGKRAIPNRSPYTSSKAGLLGLTRTAAAEGGPHGVTANAICPGSVTGERIDDVIEKRAANSPHSPEEVREEKRTETLLHSFVDPEDVAATVAYLCSDAADRVTGQALNVSGGKTID